MKLNEIKIELTNYCKRNCIHCSSDANTQNIMNLNIEDLKKVIDEASKLGVNSIVLTGGEATEFANIEEVVSIIKSKNINTIKLYTMCEPTPAKLELINNLINLGLSDIIYSLTISLTTDRKITYDNIIEFLKTISTKINLNFHYCLTTKSINELDDLEKILNKISNFKSLSFLRYVEHGRGKDDLTLSRKDLIKIKRKILELMRKYPQKIHLGSPFNILNITNTKCSAGEETMIIGFDGNVYPCDAMKYFTFLGSGGSIYTSSLENIYNSTYFKEIRNANKNINLECNSCSNEKCLGGCLAQKMLALLKKDETKITVKWYQTNALRTMNNFSNIDTLKFNAYTGIAGEAGEFFDYMKKLYTHNLSLEKKKEILSLAPKELGDLVWYLSTSLAVYYNYTLDEVYDHIISNPSKNYKIDKNLINFASLNKDPLCFSNDQATSYNIDVINNYLSLEKYQNVELDEKVVFQILQNFKKVLNNLDYVEEKKEVVAIVAKILMEVATISLVIFKKNLSDILSDNIEKLRLRYPSGFDEETANQRIDANKKYKKEENYKLILKK